MGAASAAAISVMALGRRRLGLNVVWCGLALCSWPLYGGHCGRGRADRLGRRALGTAWAVVVAGVMM